MKQGRSYYSQLMGVMKLPNAPSGVTVDSVTDTTVNLSWDPVSHYEGISNYIIHRDGIKVGTSDTNSFTDSSLTPETTYNYQVSAVGNNLLEGYKSDVVEVTTSATV